MRYLITGGCGFVGSNLAYEVLNRNEDLLVLDNLYKRYSEKNLEWLEEKGDFLFFHSDIRNQNDVEHIISEYKPNVIFHLAGQVAMTTSLGNPRLDFEVNTLGTYNVLEAVRKYSPESIILYSSTNKVYGDLEYLEYEELEKRYVCKEYPEGFDESLKLDFTTPYGCSKGSADQYLLDYNKMFGIRTVVFRHSSMYGGRQFSTYDQGWVGWFCQKAIDIYNNRLKKPFTISGNGKQVRDLLYAKDVVKLYFLAEEQIKKTAGKVFNIGGGIENSFSILELFDYLEELLGIRMEYTKIEKRKSDQKVFVANISKAKKMINWEPRIDKKEGINSLTKWIMEYSN